MPVMRFLSRHLLLSFVLLSGVSSAALADEISADQTGIYAGFLNGRFASSQGDSDRAATEFLHALAAEPGNRDVQQQAFIACVLSGRAEALTLAPRLPASPVAQMLLADQAARAGRWDEAVQRFSALPDDGVTHLLRPLLIAWARQAAGQTDDALAILQPLTTDRQLPGLYALHAALISDFAGRTDAAAALYATARSGNGTPPLRLAQLIGSFEARQQRSAQALQALDAVADNAPLLHIALPALAAHIQEAQIAGPTDGIAEAYVGIAAALNQDGDHQLANVLIRLALDMRPDLTPARLLAADVMEAQHDRAGAGRILAAVPDSDPLSAVVRLRVAELTARDGSTEDALAQLRALATSYPDSPLPDTESGDILRANGNYEAAAAAYSRAIAHVATPGASDWPLFYNRGVAYSQSGDWTRAEADFHHALELQPNQPLVLNYLAYSWADRGENLPESREMLETASRLRPDDGAIIDSLGWVMLRQGEDEAAVRTLERAVELEPADSTINGHLGDAYWAVGRKMEATYQWRRALIFNPLPADAAKLQAKLHETTAQATSTAPTRIP